MHLRNFKVKTLAFASVSDVIPIALGRGQGARYLVRVIVKSELAADASDHSRWIFGDATETRGKNIVKLTVQTAQGDLSRLIEIDGNTTQQWRRDDRKQAQPRRKQRRRR
jgi:hypothetical protein